MTKKTSTKAGERTQFTPGPWRVKDHYEGGIGVFGPPHKDGGDYAPIVRFLNCRGVDFANASLIAAAPEQRASLIKAEQSLTRLAIELERLRGTDFKAKETVNCALAAAGDARAAILKGEGQ
jgi:hypothetical protein